MDDSNELDVEYDTWILLSRVYRMIANLRRMELSKYEILPVQAYILLVISKLGNDTSPSEISQYVYQQKNSVSDILNRMEKQGLVQKTEVSGKKARIHIKLTEEGERVLKLSREREYLHKVMSSLTREKTKQLVSCLEILRDNALNQFALNEKRFVPLSLMSKSQMSKYLHQKELFDE
jgi:MarR family transcriptional regulator, organic hydroperoxide resistance regulator